MLEIFAMREKEANILLIGCGVILAIPVVFYLVDLLLRRRQKKDDENNPD